MPSIAAGPASPCDNQGMAQKLSAPMPKRVEKESEFSVVFQHQSTRRCYDNAVPDLMISDTRMP
jgi:hypothetical protein